MDKLTPILSEHADANVGPALSLLNLTASLLCVGEINLGANPSPSLGAWLGYVLTFGDLYCIVGDAAIDVDTHGSGVGDRLGHRGTLDDLVLGGKDTSSSHKAGWNDESREMHVENGDDERLRAVNDASGMG